MKMTIFQFKLLKHLDEFGQLGLVGKDYQEEYLSIIRSIEIKQTGIEIKEVAHESKTNTPIDCVPNEARASGLLPTEQLDAEKSPKEGLGSTPILSQLGTRNSDPGYLSHADEIRALLAGHHRRFRPFLDRLGKN